MEKNAVLPSGFQKAKSVAHSSRDVSEASDPSIHLQLREQIMKDYLARLSAFSKTGISFVCS